MDALGRTPISDAMKEEVARSLAEIPEGRRGALVAMVDDDSNVSVSLAGRLGDHWKVAGGASTHVGKSLVLRGHAWVEASW